MPKSTAKSVPAQMADNGAIAELAEIPEEPSGPAREVMEMSLQAQITSLQEQLHLQGQQFADAMQRQQETMAAICQQIADLSKICAAQSTSAKPAVLAPKSTFGKMAASAIDSPVDDRAPSERPKEHSPSGSEAPRHSPARQRDDQFQQDFLADIFNLLHHLKQRHIPEGIYRYTQKGRLMDKLAKNPFKLLQHHLRFRTFIQQFVFEMNTGDVDFDDAASIFIAALDEKSLIYLRTVNVDFSELHSLVQALAERCQPQFSDLLELQHRFKAESPEGKTPEDYYNHLWEYHQNIPSAVSSMDVLSHFMLSANKICYKTSS
jgi:hypothetical protein